MSDKRIISSTTKLIGNTSFRVEKILTKIDGKSAIIRNVKVKDVADGKMTNRGWRLGCNVNTGIAAEA